MTIKPRPQPAAPGGTGRWPVSRRAFINTMSATLAAVTAARCGSDQPSDGSDAGTDVGHDAHDAQGIDADVHGTDVHNADADSIDAVEELIPPPPAPTIDEDPFQLGVASGDPLHDRVIIWTRLAPSPLTDGGMPDVDVPVIWEVYADEAMTTLVAQGWVFAVPELAHSVHVDVTNLQPSTFYWYRFRVKDQWTSPGGRTRTFPRPSDSPDRLRVALACCQKYRDGFYTAHAHIAETELDAVVFLGDYIYESGDGSRMEGRAPIDVDRVTDLTGFRSRYGGYRMDPDLQASHAAHPWIVTWDDHEVSNNYANMQLSERRRSDGDGREIRAAGYQAWYEHMPIRIPFPDDPAFMQIYREFSFGDLAQLYVLDARQYRDPQPCNDEIGTACEELLAGGLSILGAEQKAWLRESMGRSSAVWNLIAQQVLFSPMLMEYGLANPDQWDGYIDSREAVLEMMAQPTLRNPMVFTGDVHAAGFAELKRNPREPTSPRVALEVLTTSISSGGDEVEGIARYAGLAERLSDTVHYFDAARRGFAVCDYTRDGCEVTYFAVTTVAQRTAELYPAIRFVIDEGTLNFQAFDRVPDDA